MSMSTRTVESFIIDMLSHRTHIDSGKADIASHLQTADIVKGRGKLEYGIE